MIEINFTNGWHDWRYQEKDDLPEDEHIIALCEIDDEYFLEAFLVYDKYAIYQQMLEVGAIAWIHNADLTDIVLQLLQKKSLQ